MDTQTEQVVAEAPQAEVTNTTLADELRAAFEAAEKPQEEATQPEVGEKPVKTEEVEEDAKPEVEEKAEETDEDKKLQETVENEFPLVPKDWSEEEKKAFQALIDSDDEDKAVAAQVLIERYNLLKKGFFKKTREYSEATKEIQPINEIFKPYETTLKQNNITKSQYIENMMKWDNLLHKDPVTGVKEIMKAFNLKPEQIAPQDIWGLTEEDNSGNNEVSALKEQVRNLQNQLQALPIETQIRQFAEATDSEGKLKHPHFKEVQTVMGGLLSSNPNLTLEQAYKKAVKTLDIEASSEAADHAINLDKIREKVAKAKKASKGVKTSNGGLDFSQMSLADELKARFQGIK